MDSPTSLVSAAELWALRDDGKRYELVEGELRAMSPAGGQHGRVAMRIGSMLEQYVRANRLGQVFAAETGFLLSTNPDTVRAPDVAFVCQEKFAAIQDTAGYLPLAPDLVVEVVSPSDSSTEVEDKVQAWLRYGCQMVLVVDPATQSIRVYQDPTSIHVYYQTDHVDASRAVAGWKFAVDEVFAL